MPDNAAAAVLLVVLLGVVLMTGIWATETTAEATSDVSTNDEQINRTDEEVALSADGNRYYNETVTFADSGEELADSEYTWDEVDGTISFNRSDGETMNVTYQTASTTEENAVFITVLAPLWRIGALFPLLAMGGAVLLGVSYLKSKSNGGGAY